MVHCSQCGAANPDQSTHCSECGAVLPTEGAGVRCPMCGHINPEGQEACERCSARLTPLVASATSEASDEPIPTEEPEAVPDWLDRMRDSARSEVPPSAESEVEPEPQADEDLDWLRRLEPSDPTAFEELEEGSTEVPDWLRRLESEADAAPAPSPEELPEPAAEDEVPGWLAGLASEEKEAAPEEEVVEPAVEEEVPDWLAELAPGEEEAVEPEPPGKDLAEDEVPDWLAGLASEEEEGAPEEEAVEPAVEGEVPDWLAELAPDEEEPVEPEPVGEDLAEDEVPDWLAALASEEEEGAPEEEAVEPAVEGEVPDWLAELAPDEEEPVEQEPEEPVAEPLAEGEVPDWLAELAPTEEEGAPEEEVGEPLAEAEMPDWLEEMAAAEEEPVSAEAAAEPLAEAEMSDRLPDVAAAADEAEPEERAAEPLAETEMPDWMLELAAAAGVVAAEKADEEKPAEEAPEELPDWVAEMIAPEGEAVAEEDLELLPSDEVEVPGWLLAAAPAEATQEAAEVGPPRTAEEELAQAELPEWIKAMRPGVASAEEVTEEAEEEESVETTGLLAGIPGVVPPAAAVIATPSPAVPAKPQVSTEATMARARLWQELIARSTQPSPQRLPKAEAKKTRYRIERWIIYAIVLLAVTIPLVMDVDLSSIFVSDQPLTTEAGAAFDLIDELVTEETLVLMAFDYDPSFVGELQVQAESILQHLSERRARIIAVSLVPEGAGLAQQLLDEILSERSYQVGEDYVNLGYLPGEAIGIRSLRFILPYYQSQAFDGTQLADTLVLEGGESLELSDMALTIVLTEKDDNLRWWVEQTTTLERELDVNLPLVAGVSAAIEALARPYYDMDSPQIDGLVVGLAGAVDYERKLDWLDGPAHVRLNGQLVGQSAVFVLIVIGMLIYGLLRRGEDDA